MPGEGDESASVAAANTQSPERVLLAGAMAAVFLVIVVVGTAAIIWRVAGASPNGTSPLFAAGTIAVVLTWLPWARRGRGPLSMIARRLPLDLDGGLRRRPMAARLAGVLALVAVVQVARLSCFMADPALSWGSAFPPEEFGVRHMCLSAYVHAADLSRRGVENVYAEEYYPAYHLGRAGEAPAVSSAVANLGPHLRDAFEYPPPFLLLPRAALLATNDFLVIRTGWFMLQVPLFCAVALGLASRVGGRRALVAGLLVPALLSSFPLLFNFQFGQFQLAAVLLAVGGMMAFSAGRDRLGGALLAAAIVTKIFPGFLLVYLAVQRRVRPLLWTLAFAAAYALAGLLVLGPAPYRAFFEYHLPRLASGEAFAFFRATDLTLAANVSVFAIPFKLQRLGVPGMSEALAVQLTWVYTVLLVGVTLVAARRRRDPALEPAVWLALLALCALRSPDAPNVYVGTTSLWLLTMLAVEARGRVRWVALLVVAWFTISVQPPLPDPRGTIVLWMSGQIGILISGFWVMLRRREVDWAMNARRSD